jgi:hypothetical protein
MVRTRYLVTVFGLAVGFAACASGAGGGRTSDECADACAKIDGANCGDIGESCVASCVHGPSTSGDECKSELLSYADCFWSAEAYACDDELGTIASSCAEQLNALDACRSGDSGAGGAAGAGGADEASGAGGAPTRDVETPSGAGGA